MGAEDVKAAAANIFSTLAHPVLPVLLTVKLVTRQASLAAQVAKIQKFWSQVYALQHLQQVSIHDQIQHLKQEKLFYFRQLVTLIARRVPDLIQIIV